MPIVETVTLVLSIISAIHKGIPIFEKLWAKLKNFFGGSKKQLQESSQALVQAHLESLLRSDQQLRLQTEAYYRSRGAIKPASQWEVWTEEDDREWA